jgi:hypothetical protein
LVGSITGETSTLEAVLLETLPVLVDDPELYWSWSDLSESTDVEDKHPIRDTLASLRYPFLRHLPEHALQT